MPCTDYTSTGGGLKLKGAKAAGIDKKKKKKSKKEKSSDSVLEKTSASTLADKDGIGGKSGAAKDDGEGYERETSVLSNSREQLDLGTKTEAERRHDEMRRKRLDERLKREGVKTHKEKVEQLNKYLSTLSEHHDMPRIGPG